MRLRPRDRLLPRLLAWPAGIVVSVAVGVGASLALKTAFGERTFLPRPFVAASVTVTLSLAAFFAVERFFGRWLSRAGLAGGMLAWWGTLAVALSFWNPGLSYLLTWPAMALAVAALLVREGRLWLALPIATLPGAILFIPLIVQSVLGVSPLHPFAPLFGVLAAGFAAPRASTALRRNVPIRKFAHVFEGGFLELFRSRHAPWPLVAHSNSEPL